MATNINVRRTGDVSHNDTPAGRSAEWEPSRVMRALLSWDPFRELSPSYPAFEDSQLATAFDVKDTPDAFVFHADVPGIQDKDIEVQVHGTRLTIRGKRESEKKQPGHTYYAFERSYGSFARTFTLPESADTQKVSADLKDGVLTVTVPKKASEQPRTIAVKTQADKS